MTRKKCFAVMPRGVVGFYCENCVRAKGHGVVIDYTNYKNIRRFRRVEPLLIYRAANDWHPKEQWLLDAIDLEDDSRVKSFAMSGIHSWRDDE